MSKSFILSTVIFSVFISGCSTFEGYPTEADEAHFNSSKTGKFLNYYLSEFSNPQAYSSPRDARNDMIRKRMAEIDFAYQRFEKKIHVESVRGKAYTQWGTNFIDGVTGVVGNINDAKGLTALSLFVKNGKSTFDNAALISSTMPALISEMKASRKKLKTGIMQKMRSGVEQYDIYTAWSDLNDYYISGTIPNAIASLNAKSKDSENKADDVHSFLTTPRSVSTRDSMAASMGGSVDFEAPLSTETSMPNPSVTETLPPVNLEEAVALPNISNPTDVLNNWIDRSPLENTRKLADFLEKRSLEVNEVMFDESGKFENDKKAAISALNILN
jgi:hypothetical protein